MPVDRPKPERRDGGLGVAAALFVLVLGAFLPCLWNGFIRTDDPLYVTQNPHVQEGLTWASVKWAFGSEEAQNWHPLTWLSHIVDGQLFGLKPAGHHATSVVLHALNSAILFLLLRKMTGARWRSFAVAGLFGLHPLRVESVAWVAERKDVLSALFFLLTLWAYTLYVQTRNTDASPTGRAERTGSARRNYCLALAFFTLGLLAKPMLVTAPFILLLLDFWPLGRLAFLRLPKSSGAASQKKAAANVESSSPAKPSLVLLFGEKVPFFALAAASCVVTYLVQQQGGAVTPLDSLSLKARLANALVSYARYVGKSFWPVNLSALYPHPGNWQFPEVAGAGLFLGLVTVLVLRQWRREPFLAVGWLWFLGMLVPVIGLVQVGLQAMADRYTYLPSIGLWLAVVWGAARWMQGFRDGKRVLQAALAGGLVACIVLTERQIGYWKDSITLFTHAMRVTDRNWAAATYLAKELQSRGELDEAIRMCHEAIQINPYRPAVRCELADMLATQRHYEKALEQYQEAAKLDPTDAYARERAGGMLQNLGRVDEAIVRFNEVIRLRPDYADAYSNLGNCYGMKGRTDEAIRCFEEALKLKPNVAENHRDLGVGLANKGRLDEAIAQFQKALELDPSDAQARGNLAWAMRQKAQAAP